MKNFKEVKESLNLNSKDVRELTPQQQKEVKGGHLYNSKEECEEYCRAGGNPGWTGGGICYTLDGIIWECRDS